MKSSTAKQVVIFSCLALAALTVRPIWVGVQMVRAPPALIRSTPSAALPPVASIGSSRTT